MNRSKKFFISHSENDKDIVKYFADDILISGLGIHPNDIFCTSQKGMEIKPGTPWMEEIKENLKSCKLVFLIITPNFKASEVCQNELGASWIYDKDVIILCIEPISKSNATVLYNINQVEELNKEDSLDRIRDVINDKYTSEKVSTVRWASYRKEFVTKINRYLTKHPFKETITGEEFKGLKQKYEELDKTYNELYDKYETLQEMNEKLKKCKNKSAVEKVLEEYSDTTNIDKFDEYVTEAKKMLENYHASIRTLIFNSYTGADFEIDYQTYKNSIEEAIANKIINRDGFKVLWDNDKRLEKLSIALGNIHSLTTKISGQEFKIICDKYDVQELDVNRLDFWTDIIGLNMYY